MQLDKQSDILAVNSNFFWCFFLVVTEISKLLETGLDSETLAICIKLCENGVNPEALAMVIQELRRETAALKVIITSYVIFALDQNWNYFFVKCLYNFYAHHSTYCASVLNNRKMLIFVFRTVVHHICFS